MASPWLVAIPLGSESYCLSTAMLISTIPTLWRSNNKLTPRIIQTGALGATLAAIKSTAALELIISSMMQLIKQKPEIKRRNLALAIAAFAGAMGLLLVVASNNQTLYSLRPLGLIRGLTADGGSHAGLFIGEAMHYLAVENKLPPITISINDLPPIF